MFGRSVTTRTINLSFFGLSVVGYPNSETEATGSFHSYVARKVAFRSHL